jgi:hypothetical protein
LNSFKLAIILKEPEVLGQTKCRTKEQNKIIFGTRNNNNSHELFGKDFK